MKKVQVKAKNPLKTLKQLFLYLKDFKGLLTIISICILVSVAANVIGTYYIKEMMSTIIDIRDGIKGIESLAIAISIMIVIYALGTVATYVYNRLIINISTGIMHKIRDQMFMHMQRLPVQYFSENSNGEIMSTYTNDTDALREMLSQGIPQFLSSLFTVLGIFVVMLVLSPLLTGLVVIMLIAVLVAVMIIGKKSSKYFVAQQSKIASVNGYIEEYIEGQKVVKAFCHEDKVKSGFDEFNESLRESSYQAHTFANLLMPIIGNLAYLNYAITAVLGGILVIKGMLGNSVSDGITIMAAFLPATRQFSMPMTQVAQHLNSVLLALAGAERIFNLLDQNVEEDNGYVTLTNAVVGSDGSISESKDKTGIWAWKKIDEAGNVSYEELKGDVKFNNVVFSYDGKKTVLKNISLYAKPAQKIAFVGSTGAGKTTITNLINRFYDIQEGEILFDGINVLNIKKDDLRHSLGLVLQDTHLFTGTVRDNIRYGRLDATDQEVENAAKLANAHFFITHLENGYDTVLSGSGTNLSQGQRQLLSIARAAVADTPVLILDEATSSIDTRTEKLIEKGMDSLMKGRTVFVIAHRLSTVRNADAILVLENGEIIERGNHDALLLEKGRYHKLYVGGVVED